jgi:hypothetical protein
MAEQPPVAAPAAPANPYDPAAIIAALDQAAEAFDSTFSGNVVSNEAARFHGFLSTVRGIVDQAADMAPKNVAMAQKIAVLSDQPGVVYPVNPLPANMDLTAA